MKLETNIDNINDKLELHVVEQREDFKNIMEKLDSMEGKFAGKWVEKVTLSAVLILLTTLATVLLT